MNKATLAEWQDRRAKILQTACNEIENRVRAGQPIMRTIRLMVRKFRSRSLGRGRRLRLSKKTLHRLWRLWRVRRDTSIFALRYRVGFSRVPVSDEAIRSLAETRIFENRPVAEIIRRGEIRTKDGRRVSVRLAYRRLKERNLPATALARLATRRLRLDCRIARAERLILKERAKLVKEIQGILA